VLKAGVNGSNDCYTGWESNFHLEVEEVSVNGGGADDDTGRFVLMGYGNVNGNHDGRDNGYINNRVLKFKKFQAESIIRFAYSDNLRVHGHGKWCKWELKVNGQPCKDNLSGNRHTNSNQNDHTPGMIVGYCKGLAQTKGAQTHELKVHVKGNSADCYTGWDRQSQGSYMLEAIEFAGGVIQGVKNVDDPE